MTFGDKIQRAIENLKSVEDSYIAEAEKAIMSLCEAFGKGRKLLVFGNGGSAADAQHICGELVGRFHFNRAGLPAIALGADSAVMTALGNDFEYSSVFARQVEAHGQAGDVAWGISTSGNSDNVVLALERARDRKLITIGMTGQGGGKMTVCCDILLRAPTASTPEIQEIHQLTYHFICSEVERRMFKAI